MPPVLLSWDASIDIAGAGGERRSLPLAAFFRGYRDTALGAGDYVAAVTVPRKAVRRPHRIFKLSKRFEDDISTVLAAVSLAWNGDRVTEARVAYGGIAATPARAEAAEAVLAGSALDAATIDAACEAVLASFTPIDDVRASAAYRSAMAAALLRRALIEIRDGADLGIDAAAPLVHA
jgi:xanthine dehydrogenase small subunit